MDWLTFWPEDSETLMSWQRDVSSCLKCVSDSRINRVRLLLPSKEDAVLAWRDNLDLHGSISFKTKDVEIGPYDIALPFNGVFVKRGVRGDSSNAYTWSSWLAELPGVCRVWSMTDAADRRTASIRIGLLDGRFIELNCVKKAQKMGKTVAGDEGQFDAEEKKQLQKIVSMKDEVRLLLAWANTDKRQRVYPRWLLDALTDVDTVLAIPKIKKNSKEVRLALVRFADKVRNHADELMIYDRDDLGHRMLVTFPVWLRYRILRRFLYLKSAHADSSLAEILSQLADGLVPVGSNRNRGAFDLVRPDNIIELAARISSVKRYGSGARVTGLLPAHFRQNHPSFEGRICPIETPESDMVGVALHLARGAKIDSNGQIVKSDMDAGVGCQPCVGWCTSLIPFFHHNDDARNMMGAKNLRQSIRVNESQSPLVLSGGEQGLVERFGVLSEVGIAPSCTDDQFGLSLGRNLLVAYLPWKGWNVDDAVIISEGLRDKMAIVERKRYSELVDLNWRLLELHPKGVVKCGEVIASFEGLDGACRTFHYADSDEATLESVVFPDEKQRSPGFLYRFEYVIKKTFRLGPGDKLMGRHGNKGVVSKVLPDDEMPHVDVPGQGRIPVDILLNPHGVLSRMNPGQLLESHLGWLLQCGVEESDVKTDQRFQIGYPQKGLVDHDRVRKLLSQTGLDDHGRARLWFGDQQDPEDKRVVVGYQYFYRLHHIPQLKAQARLGGAGARYSYKTGQAAQGRLRGGGQRVGEMEFWALQAYQGTLPIIREMLSSKSDAVAIRSKDKEHSPTITGFEEVLHDWFKAMMIKMERRGDNVTFSRLTDSEVCAGGDVLKLGKAEKAEAKYVCPKGSGYEFLAGAKLPLSLKESEMRKILEDDLCGEKIIKVLTLGDLLRAFNKKSEGLIEYDRDLECYWLRFEDVKNDDKGRFKLELINYRGDGSSLAFKLTVLENEIQLGWPKDLRSLTCYGRWQEGKKQDGKTMFLPAKKLLEELCGTGDAKKAHSANAYSVLCPCQECGNRSPHPNKVLRSADVGLDRSALDPLHAAEIFGEPKDVFRPADKEKWGYLKLPCEIPYPADRVFGKKACSAPIDDFKIKAIPVLPLRYRMVMHSDVGHNLVGDAYENLFTYIRTHDEDECNKDPETLIGLVAWLFACILNEIGGKSHLLSAKHVREKGKRALIRRDGLGRRVDRSCRLVITPNPELAMDEVGVPATILWELMDGNKLFARRDETSVDERSEEFVGFSWRPTNGLRVGEDPEWKYDQLREFLTKQCRWMLLNRQPSLHKYSFQSFRIKPMHPSEGDVFQLPPTCCKGFGADFDGDEMAGHYPVSKEAQSASENLSPCKNILSDGDGKPLVNFDRDFVMGVSLLDPKKDSLEKIIEDICKEPGAIEKLGDISRKAYRKCTEERVSFGFYDLVDLQKNGAAANWEVRLKKALDAGDPSSASRFVARMVLSGANGKKQIHQLVDARDELPPGPLGFVLSDDQKRHLNVKSTLVDGMNWDEVYWSSMNARASMCDKKLNTGLAGDLTRRLVFALQDIEDEGVKVGLIAAQSIGERGSQLSMKAAHEGRRVVDIDEARRIILSGVDAEGKAISKYEDFEKALCGEGDATTPYDKLKDKGHLKLLWDRLAKARKEAVTANPKAKASVGEVLNQLEGLNLLAQGKHEDFARHILASRNAVSYEIGSIFAKVMFNYFD